MPELIAKSKYVLLSLIFNFQVVPFGYITNLIAFQSVKEHLLFKKVSRLKPDPVAGQRFKSFAKIFKYLCQFVQICDRMKDCLKGTTKQRVSNFI